MCSLSRSEFSSWWRHQMETFSALLALGAENAAVPGEFPTQRPATLSFDVFFDLRLNTRLSKHSWGWWFETQSSSLRCHCNDELIVMKAHKRFQNGPGPLLTKRYDLLPPNIASSGSLEIGCYNHRIALKFERQSAVMLFICLSNFRAIGKVYTQITLLRNFARSCGKTSDPFVNRPVIIYPKQNKT